MEKLWTIAVVILGLMVVGSMFYGNQEMAEEKAAEITGFTVLTDSRCKECNTEQILAQLNTLMPEAKFSVIDYNTASGKKLYDEKFKGMMLPMFIFTDDVKEDREAYAQLQNYLEPISGFMSLRVGAAYDPYGEICDNKIDDNSDGLTDCEDEKCKGQYYCMEKKDKPEVELFVMSHCPYGTQIEKGMIPVMEKLGEKADIKIKFCDYAMHGETEVWEQTRQYCIQKEQQEKYLLYLKCFLEAGDSEGCLSKTAIDSEKMDACVKKADTEFDITTILGDQTKWKGRFPTFNIFAEENAKYGVQGSPSMVVNGVQVSTGRDAQSLMNVVCAGFKEKPAECDEKMDAASPSPGFGYNAAAGSASTGGCGA